MFAGLYSWSWMSLRHEVLSWAKGPFSQSPIRACAYAVAVFFSGVGQDLDRAISLGEQARQQLDTQPDPHWHHVLAPWDRFCCCEVAARRPSRCIERRSTSLISRPTRSNAASTGPIWQWRFARAARRISRYRFGGLRADHPDRHPAYTAYVAYPLADALIDQHRARKRQHCSAEHSIRQRPPTSISSGASAAAVAIHAESLGTDVRAAYEAALSHSLIDAIGSSYLCCWRLAGCSIDAEVRRNWTSPDHGCQLARTWPHTRRGPHPRPTPRRAESAAARPRGSGGASRRASSDAAADPCRLWRLARASMLALRGQRRRRWSVCRRRPIRFDVPRPDDGVTPGRPNA